jgi:hypothetical protein
VEDQEHVGAPAAEALDGRDLAGDPLVGELLESVQLELSAPHARREVAQVTNLLPREPDLPQNLVLGGEQLRGRWRAVAEERGEAGVDRTGRLGRELLADDGAHEGAVGVVGTPAAAGGVVEGSDPAHERGHDRVAALAQEEVARVEGGGLRGHTSGRRRASRPGSSSPGSTSARR